jgi:hypothetical protein
MAPSLHVPIQSAGLKVVVGTLCEFRPFGPLPYQREARDDTSATPALLFHWRSGGGWPIQLRSWAESRSDALRRPRSCELPEPRQALQVIAAGPDTPPAVPSGREPAAGPSGGFAAMVRLERSVVHHLPASARLDDEARARIAGLGHSHGPTVDRGSLRGCWRLLSCPPQ